MDNRPYIVYETLSDGGRVFARKQIDSEKYQLVVKLAGDEVPTITRDLTKGEAEAQAADVIERDMMEV